MPPIVPLLSAAVSAVFAIVVLLQYARRRRRYQLVWGTGLAMFSIAATAGFLARSGGATAVEYRVFYLFGAILNVAWLAAGTVALLARRRVTDFTLAGVLAFSAVSTLVVLSSPVDLSAAIDTGRGFQDVPGPRILAAVGSGLGTVVLVGGALLSGWGFARRGHQARRALANVIIAAGVIITAAGGTATFSGASGVVELSNLIGITVMFLGFLLV